MTAKNIVLCIDGTWNAPNPLEDTNVRKMFEWSLVDNTGRSQVCCYLPGVGEDMEGFQTSVNSLVRDRPPVEKRIFDWIRRKLNAGSGGIGGKGTAERIREAYDFLCRNYQRGDKIFIFGFSRGAFAARSLAGFASIVGVLLAHRLDALPEAYRLYELSKDGDQAWLKEEMRRLELRVIETQEDESALPIHFLGVWDTVGALGLPRRMSVFSARFTEYHQVEVPPNVFIARHAMALHELRPDFDLMLWSDTNGHRNLRQAWFPGDHADVGGGHLLSEAGYADTALHWMAGEASKNGLQLKPPSLPVNKRRLHQQSLWFLINSPTIRPEVHELSRYSGSAWNHATYCHDSVELHLDDQGGRPYDFFSAGLNTALTSVDGLAGRLYVRSRTLNLIP